MWGCGGVWGGLDTDFCFLGGRNIWCLTLGCVCVAGPGLGPGSALSALAWLLRGTLHGPLILWMLGLLSAVAVVRSPIYPS